MSELINPLPLMGIIIGMLLRPSRGGGGVQRSGVYITWASKGSLQDILSQLVLDEILSENVNGSKGGATDDTIRCACDMLTWVGP